MSLTLLEKKAEASKILDKYEYVCNMDECGWRRHFSPGNYQFILFGYPPDAVEWEFCQLRNNGSPRYKFTIKDINGELEYYIPSPLPADLPELPDTIQHKFVF
jgi:hypothetical protein